MEGSRIHCIVYGIALFFDDVDDYTDLKYRHTQQPHPLYDLYFVGKPANKSHEVVILGKMITSNVFDPPSIWTPLNVGTVDKVAITDGFKQDYPQYADKLIDVSSVNPHMKWAARFELHEVYI